MAGCYGNHPFDRIMEAQLFRWLDKQENGIDRRILLLKKKQILKNKRNGKS